MSPSITSLWSLFWNPSSLSESSSFHFLFFGAGNHSKPEHIPANIRRHVRRKAVVKVEEAVEAMQENRLVYTRILSLR